jgi:hypothetical protein
VGRFRRKRERRAVLNALAENRSARAIATAAAASSTRELRDLVRRGDLAGVHVRDLARAAGLTEDATQAILSTGQPQRRGEARPRN